MSTVGNERIKRDLLQEWDEVTRKAKEALCVSREREAKRKEKCKVHKPTSGSCQYW